MWLAITIISAVILLAAILVFILEKKPEDSNVLHFRIKNIVLPIAIALISTVVLIICFTKFDYKIPFRFDADGNVTKSMAAYSYILLMVGVQYAIVLLNVAANIMLIKLSAWITKNSPMVFNANMMHFIVTNLFVIPQLIMAFIFINSAYYVTMGHILMLPIHFSLITIMVSFFVLIILFIRGYFQTKNVSFKE